MVDGSSFHLASNSGVRVSPCSRRRDDRLASGEGPLTSSEQQDNTEPTFITNTFNHACELISSGVQNIANAFTPLVDLFQGLEANEHAQIKGSDLASAFNQIKTTLDESHISLSPEARQLIDRVHTLANSDNLSDMDLAQLISQWRNNADTRALFEMAERIRSGECVTINNENLRQTFIQGLESLGQALEEASGHPPGAERDQAIHELEQSANAVVDCVECVNERGGDDSLTEDDRGFIRNRLEDARGHVERVVSDDILSSFVSDSLYGLKSFTSWITEYFDKMREEEKARNKEECEERHEKQEEARRLHSYHLALRRKKLQFYYLMKHLKREAFLERLRELNCLRQQLLSKWCNSFNETVRRLYGRRSGAEAQYKKYAGLSYHYQKNEAAICDSLPPSSVCLDTSYTVFYFPIDDCGCG